MLVTPNDAVEIMEFRSREKIGKSWPMIIGKLWQQVAVALGEKINA
jgi:hypothetical protein